MCVSSKCCGDTAITNLLSGRKSQQIGCRFNYARKLQAQDQKKVFDVALGGLDQEICLFGLSGVDRIFPVPEFPKIKVLNGFRRVCFG